MKITADNQITVHGREGLNLRYKRYTTANDGSQAQFDLSSSNIFFEVKDVLRIKLIADPQDAKGLIIRLTRAQTDTLSASSAQWATVDETGSLPLVERQGTIKRAGWDIAPPTII